MSSKPTGNSRTHWTNQSKHSRGSLELQDAAGNNDSNLNEKLIQISEWLKIPIYVYHSPEGSAAIDGHQHCVWAKYEPDVFRTNRECRFYITLFYNVQEGSFDRITPLKGCNCQIPPPLSILQNNHSMGQQNLECINPQNRHHPLVAFLSTEPDANMFQVEVRDFSGCSQFSPIRIAMNMNTMKERTFDCQDYIRHSFLRCLSKEIFGHENHVGILIKEMSDELLQNISEYMPFVGENLRKAYKAVGKLEDNEKCRENMARLIIERIEDDLPCDELLLKLACTIFQTPIYVFRIEDRDECTLGFWTKYRRVYKRKRDSLKKTSFVKKCQRDRVYYISVLETGIQQYCRIIPKLEPCNCMLEKPNCLLIETDPTEYHSRHDYSLMRTMRAIDNCLNASCFETDQWMLCNQMLQEHSDSIIQEIESRRKNVNIATITGTSAGILGAVLTGVGIGLAPITAGVSTILSIVGASIAISGGTVATGAKITESVLNKDKINTLKRYQNAYHERFENLKLVLARLREGLKKLGELTSEIQANQDLETSDYANIQSIPGIIRAIKGLVMIPLTVLNVSSRGLMILGTIIGPVSAIVDVTFLAFSAYNMAKGNKTDVTENLRRISASLYGSRRQMHSWAYGNQKRFTYI
uniref:Uncharacterized protein LOC111102888 isoform X2 n=1 Tax=Crassostrea virginica TaxID=6565 RepID=A0A8B8ALP8_CRAVI|nr:uncharacterized protein LOC111102888 isoform X2 [Crassostrea virginica]